MCAQQNLVANRQSAKTRIGRREVLMAGGAGMALVAGCTGDGPEPAADDADDNGGATTATGTFRLLISDRPNAIDHFDSLEVTFDEARVFQTGANDGAGENGADDEGDDDNDPDDGDNGGEDDGNDSDDGDNGGGDDDNDPDEENDDNSADQEEDAEENDDNDSDDGDNGDGDDDNDPDEENDDNSANDGGDDENNGNEDGEGRGFFILDLDGETVDLTEVVGDKAISVFEGDLEAGRYTKIELSVDEIKGTLTDDVAGGAEAAENGSEEGDDEGEADDALADVKVPSEKLQIVKPFELSEGSELSFVFDINVVQRGQEARYNLLPVIDGSGVNGKDVDVEEVGEQDDAEDDEDANDGQGGLEREDENEGNESNETDQNDGS